MARLGLAEELRERRPTPVYQRSAAKAVSLRYRGYSAHAIAVELRVTDKTVAKAIRWFKGLRLACSGPGRQGIDSCTNLGFVA